MRSLGYDRVFGIGAAKTGTSSLARALALLGFRHTSWDPDLWDAYERRDYSAIFAVADAHESFDDGPWNGGDFYRVLDERYPRSKFVLTVRDVESWSASHERHFSSTGARQIPARYLIDEYEARRGEIVAGYLERNRQVVEHFHGRPGSLLVLDVCGGQGWAPLCAFLGLAAPRLPFPHLNSS